MPINFEPSDLPETLPVFPLQGALLLPGGRLPLNIFEPRYLAMIEDALGGLRLIGMIQPRVKEQITADDSPDIYGAGCVGRLTSFTETDDGRYLITLNGLCRFTVVEELPDIRGYRRVKADYAPWLDDFNADPADGVDRDQLLMTLKRYLEGQSLQADWKAVEDTPTADLVSVMSMLCPFAPNEKQALLEAANAAARANVMMSLMDMQVHVHRAADLDEDEPPAVKH
jgi:Lon protease-like protein